MSDTTDEQLAILSYKNNKYFNEIVKRYTEKIRKYIARIISNWQESEDVTQEVFIKAYKNIASFNPKMKFSSWLYRIAHNESVNFIKKNYKIKQIEFKDEIKNDLLIINKDYLKKIIDNENANLIKIGLEKLKISEKEILELYYFEEKTYIEISDILQIPVNSVGPNISRAKKHLKKIIEQYEQPTRKN